MAIAINNTPANYSSINGDLLYTVYESVKSIDPVTYPNYRYVCDIYVGGVLVSRLKTYPSPDNNRGVFNIGRTVRNYIAFQFNPSANFVVQEFGAGEFNVSVQCKFGEEYDGTLYTNLTLDSARLFYNHYNGQLYSGETILGGYADRTASRSPHVHNVSSGGYRRFIPYFATNTSNITVTAVYYSSLNVSLGTATATIAASVAYNLLILDISPNGVNALLGGSFTINSDVAYYTIAIGASSYQVNLYCEPKYIPYCLHFLNQFGGFESFEFRKISRPTVEFTKKSFQHQAYRFDSSGIASLRTSHNVNYDSATVFAVGYNEKMKLSTDLLTDDEYRWLKDLILSPVIYLEYGSLLPVTISDTSYEIKKNVNDKLTGLQINIDIGSQLNTQYR